MGRWGKSSRFVAWGFFCLLGLVAARQARADAGLSALPFWPAAPVVTAMAIIMLGATEVTLARFQRSTLIVPTMILHGATYASLYVLFVGATLHSASVSSAAGIGFRTALDLAASVFAVAIAAIRIFSRLRQGTLSQS